MVNEFPLNDILLDDMEILLVTDYLPILIYLNFLVFLLISA